MEKVGKIGTREHVAQFILKFRVVLLAVLAIIVLGIIAAIVYEELSKANIASVTKMVEQVDTAHASLLAAKSEDEKKTLLNEFEDVVKQASSSYKGSFAEQRALFLKGTYLYNEKKYPEAESSFLLSVGSMPKSYLAPIALINAAFSAEDGGNVQKCIEYLTKLAKDYELTSAQVPRALFNLGRLSEVSQKWKEASDFYQKIIDSYSGSNWTKLARDRIIYLKSQQRL